jgi:hypothetical protein
LPFHVVASLMTFAKLLAISPSVICFKYMSIRILFNLIPHKHECLSSFGCLLWSFHHM